MTDQNLLDMTFEAKKQGFSVSLYCNLKTCKYTTQSMRLGLDCDASFIKSFFVYLFLLLLDIEVKSESVTKFLAIWYGLSWE